MRVATIDIGTNTVLLLVAEERDGGVVAIEECATITRLGQGVDKTRALAVDAILRTNACLDEYAAVIAKHGVDRVDVVGTSAMRDAQGGEAVREHAKRTLGVDARVIAGEEEARLTFLGALSGLSDAGGMKDAGNDGMTATVFDIGGGSTEIVRGHRSHDGRVATIEFAKSYDVGSVRLTERHVKTDPPSEEDVRAMTADARKTIENLPPLVRGEAPIGIAGTVTTLAAIAKQIVPYDGARVHGSVVTANELDAVVRRLASMPLAERKAVPGLEPKRADVIVGGALIVLSLLERWGASELRVSDRGVRWGLALALCN